MNYIKITFNIYDLHFKTQASKEISLFLNVSMNVFSVYMYMYLEMGYSRYVFNALELFAKL